VSHDTQWKKKNITGHASIQLPGEKKGWQENRESRRGEEEAYSA